MLLLAQTSNVARGGGGGETRTPPPHGKILGIPWNTCDQYKHVNNIFISCYGILLYLPMF